MEGQQAIHVVCEGLCDLEAVVGLPAVDEGEVDGFPEALRELQRQRALGQPRQGRQDMGARLKRFDWASRMYDVIAAHQGKEFAWGDNDCCLFVARAVDAMTDSSLELALSQAYWDEPSALAFIAVSGDLETAVSDYLGPSTKDRATRGDVVLVDGGLGDALGICTGKSVVCMGPKGLRELSRDEIKAVWRSV